MSNRMRGSSVAASQQQVSFDKHNSLAGDLRMLDIVRGQSLAPVDQLPTDVNNCMQVVLDAWESQVSIVWLLTTPSSPINVSKTGH